MQRRFTLTLLGAALAASTALLGGPAASQTANNTPPPGFTALFNGKDLTNWQGLITLPDRAKLSGDQLRQRQQEADRQAREHWSVQNGVLVYDGKGQSLQSAKDYGNFDLWVDWRILPKGDSGIYLRGNPQVQIWDKEGPRSGDSEGIFMGSGGLYNNQKNPKDPMVTADKPVGEWNTFFIHMVDDRVTIYLNGYMVVHDTPMENYWERGKPLPAKGPIELQHHGNRLEFRNIYVRELP